MNSRAINASKATLYIDGKPIAELESGNINVTYELANKCSCGSFTEKKTLLYEGSLVDVEKCRSCQKICGILYDDLPTHLEGSD